MICPRLFFIARRRMFSAFSLPPTPPTPPTPPHTAWFLMMTSTAVGIMVADFLQELRKN